MTINRDSEFIFDPKSPRSIEGEFSHYNHTNPELEEFGELAKYNIYISDGKMYFKSNYLRIILSEKPSLMPNIDFYPFNSKLPAQENKRLIIAMTYASLRNFIYAYEKGEFGFIPNPDSILTNITNGIQARFSANYGFEVALGNGEYTSDKNLLKELGESDQVIAKITLSKLQEIIDSSKNNPLFERILREYRTI